MTNLVRRKKSARFQDIAAEAGVSPATVDRVLNERDSVSPETREKVIAAAKKLSLPRHLPGVQHGLIHFDIILPRSGTPMWRRLALALQQATAMLDKRIAVHRSIIGEHEEKALLNAILKPPYRRHGLALSAQDSPRIRKAIAEVIGRGEAVVTLVTNIGGDAPVHYVGIDNYRAGAMAGYVIGRFARKPGRVLLLGSRPDYFAHQERLGGCTDVLRRSFPGLAVEIIDAETRDDPARCLRALSAALKARGPAAAVYNSGAGSSGIEHALRLHGAAGSLCWVGHEMSDDHRVLLEEGILDLAIDQDPDGQAIAAIEYMLHTCGVIEEPPLRPGPTEFRLYFSENARRYPYLPSSAPRAEPL